ncbi:MAG: hypothetical protein ACLFWM_08780 [Actinomycetota bacterium]
MSTGRMPEVSRRLLEALVEAYPRHVLSRVGAGRPHGVDQAVAEGQRRLEEALEGLLSEDFVDQRRGPLELFQEAMRFPTDALAAAGAEEVRRDPVAESALPGDIYDLAPASTRELGEDVWRAHLAWGAAKARAVTGSPPPGWDDAGR